MAAKANSQQMSIVQKDWENREFVEVSSSAEIIMLDCDD